MFVSVGFTAGIWIPLMPLGIVDSRIVSLVVLFFIACALNLLALALCEMQLDRTRGDTNLALNTSEGFVRKAAGLLFLAGAGLGSTALYRSSDLAIVLAMMQIAIQCTLCFMPARFHLQIRLLGDWGFVLFGLPWVIQKLVSLHRMS